MKQKTTVFCILILCVINIIIWLIPYYHAPLKPYTAYCITPKTNWDGVPISLYEETDCDCESEYPDYNYGKDLYYYPNKVTSSVKNKTRSENIMGTEINAKYSESVRRKYSSYSTDMYKTESGTVIGYKHDTDFLIYYSDLGDEAVWFTKETISSEAKLREVLDSHVEKYLDVSQCKFIYSLEKYGERYTYDELYKLYETEENPLSNVGIYVKYQRYVDGYPTNEVLSYYIGTNGRLRNFELSGYGEFEDLSKLSINTDKYNKIKDEKIDEVLGDMFPDTSILSRWEHLAYIDGQYIMIVDVYPLGQITEANTLQLAIPITSAPETNAIKLSIPTTAKIIVSVVSAAVIATSIIISRKKAVTLQTEQEETE